MPPTKRDKEMCLHHDYYTINIRQRMHRCLTCGFQFEDTRPTRRWKGGR